jgi:hypothetical protein
MDLFNMAQFFNFFIEKYLKKFFALPALPSNEKNFSNHHNSYKKGPNFARKTLLIPCFDKISKNSYHIFFLQQHAQNSND